MPIVGPTGGGQAGFGSGGSFTGPAEALEINGDFAYAYTGAIGATTTETTRLKFTTGNYLFVGTIRLAGMVDLTSASGGSIATMAVSLNGSTVLVTKTDGTEEDMPSADVAPLMIPAYTEVEVIQDAQNTDPDLIGTISITGRIYRDTT